MPPTTPRDALVSILIPSFNGADFLGEAIRSVFDQSYEPIELVVVDDGSTDASRQVIADLCRYSPLAGVTVIAQANRGAHAAINRGLEAARGEYLAILNCDDLYRPERIASLVPYLRTTGGLVFSGLRLIDEVGNRLAWDHDWSAWYRRALAGLDESPTVGYSLLLHNVSVTSSNFLFTRDLLERTGSFRDYRFVHDWDFLMRSLYHAEPIFVGEDLLSYRVHRFNAAESIRHRLFDEASSALRGYADLCRAVAPANVLAPCRANWPAYFRSFASRRAPFFADDRPLASLIETW